MSHLPLHLWFYITAFGGAAPMLPLALAIGVWLTLGHTWRAALTWLGLLAAAIALVTLTKVAFLGWGVGVRSLDFTGVSGHAMLSSAIFPMLGFLTLRNAPAWWRYGGVAAGLAVGVLVGVSRVVIDAHSVSEVVAGCALGAAVPLTWLAWASSAGYARHTPLSPWLVTGSLGALIIALHGFHAPTHRWVTHLALDLSGRDRPFVRVVWLAH
jgi:membrane-associated phospholipid phosphatase